MPHRVTYKFAYYCSGHGFGHATRVAAISLELLIAGHTVFLVSSAPRSIFDTALEHPAGRVSYRYAEIEPTMVQPKAYEVDRAATFENLKRFILFQRSRVIDEEASWLREEGIDCVLVDAPFVACAAAKKAEIRSVIISNFTFCSCYSYLSMVSSSSKSANQAPVIIDPAHLDPLVKTAIADYAKADLLLRLPGAIPIPAFDTDVELPSTRWVDIPAGTFKPEIHRLLDRPVSEIGRPVWDMPLVVRPVSKGLYNPTSKLELLDRLGVAESMRSDHTKILLVSFGGQIISRPQPKTGAAPYSLLPPGWIAAVCGTSAGSFAVGDPHFYPIPHTAYVPDLIALADVVLGKLGYGTCSEALATMTPFIYVPRPMFVEEYGLKRLVAHVTTVEMSREDFELGRWAAAIVAADKAGAQSKLEFVHRQRHACSTERSTKTVVEALERFLASVSLPVVEEVLKVTHVGQNQGTHIQCS